MRLQSGNPGTGQEKAFDKQCSAYSATNALQGDQAVDGRLGVSMAALYELTGGSACSGQRHSLAIRHERSVEKLQN